MENFRDLYRINGVNPFFYFAERMKNAIFVVPNLVLNGLAKIATYYANRKD